MTTTPKARKFRLRRDPRAPQSSPAEVGAGAPDLLTPDDDGFGPAPFPTAATVTGDPGSAGAAAGPAPANRPATARSSADEIEAIRAENLTGRQLRMARRVAQKNGIEASSDYEAVRLLRRRGIDPFRRSSVLELVASQPGISGAPAEPEGAGAPSDPRVQLPQITRDSERLPAVERLGEEGRAREIIRIQRDIARRRRHKMLMLMARLTVFVFLPTMLAGWYFFAVATPLFATKSEFVIQQADGAGAAGMGGMFSGTQFATSQDSITVQSYLQSRDAMLRLDRDLGFKQHFAQDWIDPVQRLEPGATNEKAYKIYSRNVKIGYDPTEGLIKMEVIAAAPEVSQKFSESLIGYAEEQVDNLTQRLRADQMQGARESYDQAEANVRAAQDRVLLLQEQLGVLDPASETGVVMTQVATFEGQLQQKRLQLQQLLDNERPNQARVDGVRGDISRLETLIANLRSNLTQSTAGTASLASVSGQLRIAEADLETRQGLLSQSLQQLETARIEANRQVRYLSVGVSPVAPDEPTYPRAFENTLLAFLIFGGIYLMMSLTASILREQVSA